MLVKRRRRFHNLTQAFNVKMRPIAGRCNYPVNGGRQFCRLTAGKFTLHPGSGYCREHEGKTAYDPVHRYRGIKEKNIQRQLQKLVSIERDVFDLIPEIQLMRGLLIDYVERFYEFREALFKWFKDGKIKPRGPVDIIEAAHLIEAVSRIIERHHRIERAGSIDLETFRRATEQMGIIVAKHVRDGATLEAIEADWAQVSLDTKTPGALPSAASVVTKVDGAIDGEVIPDDAPKRKRK